VHSNVFKRRLSS